MSTCSSRSERTRCTVSIQFLGTGTAITTRLHDRHERICTHYCLSSGYPARLVHLYIVSPSLSHWLCFVHTLLCLPAASRCCLSVSDLHGLFPSHFNHPSRNGPCRTMDTIVVVVSLFLGMWPPNPLIRFSFSFYAYNHACISLSFEPCDNVRDRTRPDACRCAFPNLAVGNSCRLQFQPQLLSLARATESSSSPPSSFAPLLTLLPIFTSCQNV